MDNVERTIISQYSSAPTLNDWIGALNAAIDPRDDIDTLYNNIWNVDTANEQGLEIWARIVAAKREFKLPPGIRGDFFGFKQGEMFPFDEAAFFTDADVVSETYRFEGEGFRMAVLIKALSNVSAADAQSINAVINALFRDRGDSYVLDTGSMTMRLLFKFALRPHELVTLTSAGYLLRPAGVLLDILQVPTPVFGFSEANGTASRDRWDVCPFDEGCFMPTGMHWKEGQ